MDIVDSVMLLFGIMVVAVMWHAVAECLVIEKLPFKQLSELHHKELWKEGNRYED